MPELIKVGIIGEFPPGDSLMFEAKGKQIAVFNVAGEVYAIDNVCNHMGASLCEGNVEDGQVTCPWHGGKFDLKSGAPTRPPASMAIETYRVEIEGDDIMVEIR